MRVLVVEDDAKVSYWLGSKLQSCGHQPIMVERGEQALAALRAEAFDVVVLDRMLPDMNGLELMQRLPRPRHPPILILSAIDQPADRVEGLRAGADDYLGKPFHFPELLARIELLGRRSQSAVLEEGRLAVEDLVMDVPRRRVTRAGRPIALTDKEFRLLRVMLERQGQVVPRSMLLEQVWGYQFDPQTNLIDVHMSKLRTKVDKSFGTPLIKTVRAVGYALG